ncbi:MAG: phosphoglycerate dehydrogenase [Anaerolineales bacterium]|nr:phosphoglycerate dehydrogenase [Anaerolineales bacterium]
MSPKIAVTTSSFAKESREPLDALQAAGFELVFNPHGRKLTKPETVELLRGADGVIAGTEALDREVLAQLPDLKIISRVGTAVDNVDREYAKERGIPVCNTPDGPTDGVAELALGGLLALLRRIPQSDASVRRGEFAKPMGRLLHGKTVAVIGMGRIGKALVRLLQPFAVNVIAVDPVRDEPFASRHSIRYVHLEEALLAADVISLHLSGSTKTPLLGAAEFAKMKPGAVLVNAARGGWIDEDALCEALKSGRLGGAYLDVFAAEPYRGPLAGLENVVLTAHIGSYALECRIGMEMDAARKVIEFFQKGGAA